LNRRRNNKEGHKENSERWLLTYSDMITLLLVLFIMMYTISTVDTQKFQSLAEQLGIVLNPQAVTVDPAVPGNAGFDSSPTAEATPGNGADDLEGQLSAMIGSAGLSGQVNVHREERGVVVSFTDALLFSSGSAAIHPDARKILDSTAKIIRSADNYIRVEGSTDNRPIHTRQFPSNWELAFHRANNVGKILIADGVNPSRVSVVSYGENRPVAPNDTDANRQLNRRVDIVFLDQSLNRYEPGNSG